MLSNVDQRVANIGIQKKFSPVTITFYDEKEWRIFLDALSNIENTLTKNSFWARSKTDLSESQQILWRIVGHILKKADKV
jgi:hypothetical protein